MRMIPLCVAALAVSVGSRTLAGHSESVADSLEIRSRTPMFQEIGSQGANRYSRGFYNTDERMGLGMRWTDSYRAYEFTWARVPLRRLSLGIFAETDVNNSHPEKLGSIGGGVSGFVFPVLPSRYFPLGAFVGGRAGGRQYLDDEWQRKGGLLLGRAEAGAYAQFGKKVMLIPRASVRRTEYWAMRNGKKTGSSFESGVHLGAEIRVRTFIPGFFVYTSQGNTTYEVTLRFAYK